ncbi:flagellar motor stator protein MotA [Mangrovicoccus algicola]|uniref:Flagellar motor stator protein MotA n=1 Tax=Mangrovicoccus algicola TaxID=2771008 RepID=A0A8J6YYN3_9RHOB|nr:flagellar motor stator protein MotA [Mangrovicoccus algicola]
MIAIIGIVVIFAMVFGGYMLAGGKMGLIIKALPFEMMMIGGAAIGAFLISNDGAAAKHTLADIKKVFSGPKWKSDHYQELLCLLFEILRLARQNPVALEEHIENPSESSIFSKYPQIVKDKNAIELICDTMRAASMNYDDPHQVEEILEKRISALEEHAQHSSHALQMVADGLPALGIVAAVLGVIKTMGSIDQPPEILGKMIGGALVGTFLGVFLAYGFVGPFATRVKAVMEDEAFFYKIIREVLIANLYRHSTNICIEVGRQNIPGSLRPDFSALEEALKSTKQAAE